MTGTPFDEAIRAAARRVGQFPPLTEADRHHTASNPLCGDRVEGAIRLQAGHVAALHLAVRGCLICQSSATLAMETASGWPLATAAAAAAHLSGYLDGKADLPDHLAAFAMFSPLRRHPSRQGCATLPLRVLAALIETSPERKRGI